MDNEYTKEYINKLRTCDEVVGMIRDGEFISAGQFAGNPHGLFSSLHKIKGRAKDVTFQCSAIFEDYPFLTDEELVGTLFCESFFYGAKERKAHTIGLMSFMPGGLSLVAAKKLNYRKPTMFWGMSSPMDAHGNFNIGLSIAYEMEMLEEADIVVIEVNEQAPRVFGDNTVAIRDVDFIVEHSHSIPTLSPSAITDVEDAIGANVASLVEDGATIQLGIGNIPDAVGLHLLGKKDLNIHTELITDSMAWLYRQGAVTNKGKRLWKNKIVGTFIMGSKELYEFVNDNPIVELKRGSTVNNPFVIALNDNQCSINTAISVDLTGAVASESIGHTQYSATGGQFETAYGAQYSKGGKSIIALRSTAKKGTVSTIVPRFEMGTVTTLGRNDVDFVVTEYGVAAMRGRAIRDRVPALINIAHPDFRDGLRAASEELKIW